MVYENIITGVEEEKLLPYEKCLEYGASSLDNAELLAAIIRTGTNGLSSIQLAEKLLENAGNLNGLYGMSVSELMQIKGIGKAKAVQICCILELSRRIAKQKARERLDFSNAETIAEYYMEDMRHLKREHLVLVMLDNRCRLAFTITGRFLDYYIITFVLLKPQIPFFCKFTQIITYLLHITRTMWNCTYLFKIFKDSLWL